MLGSGGEIQFNHILSYDPTADLTIHIFGSGGETSTSNIGLKSSHIFSYDRADLGISLLHSL